MKSVLMFLTEADGRCRQIVNGVVTSLNKKTPIPNPIGTRDIVIMWERSLTRWAQVRNFSLPLAFVLDGATILRNDYYKFNIDRSLFLLIKRYVCETDAVYFRSYYKHLYKGELDFSTFDDQAGDSKTTINIMEGGLSKLVKAQENTQFELVFGDDEVTLDGVELNEKHNFLTQSGFYLQDDLLGILFINKEGSASGVATFTIYKQNEPGDLTTSLEYFLITTAAITNIRLVGTVVFQDITPGSYTVRLKSSTGQNISLGSLSDAGTINVNQLFDSAADEKWFLVLDGDGIPAGIITESTLSIEFVSRFASTNVKILKPYDAYKQLCAKMGIQEVDVVSEKLQSSTYCLTSGDAIRGIEGATIKTSFNEFCKAYDVYHFTGVQIKDTVEMEGRDNYFDTSDPIALGVVKEMKVTPAVDLMYSSIKIGHADQTVDDVNGKFDFNGYHIYTTPIKRVSKELDLQSPYKAGPYEIEITRINLEGKTTTGNSNDNDTFVLDVNLSEASPYSLDRSVIPDSGVPSPSTIFNVRLRPSALFQQHYRWIRSWLHGFDSDSIVFEQANRNGDLVVDGLTDGRDIAIASMGERIFIPDYMEFGTNVPIDLQDTLDDTPNKAFSVEWEDETYILFLWKSGLAPNSRQEQVFKMLSAKDNDRLKLIA